MGESSASSGVVRSKATEDIASILLVDDHPPNLLSLRALLDGMGLRIEEARTGEEAIERMRTQDFAAVLLDVLMPGMNGFDTAKVIRTLERSKHTPVIFLTANDIDRSQLEEAYGLGAVDFLVKPFLPIILQAKVRGFVEIFLDKDRARREAAQLRLLVQGTTEYAIFLLDPDGYMVTWNAGAERLKGYKADEIIGRHFSKFYPQDAIDRGWPAYELKTAEEVGRFEDEGWRVRKDGTQFWANVIITALKDDTGRLQGFSKITRDMTERKNAEENARRLVEETTARRVAEENARLIQEQRERLHTTLASIGDGVISTDSKGRVQFLNPVAEELTGWNNDEAVTRPLTEVFNIVNESSRQTVENPALRALRDGKIVGLANHTVLISKDGTERPIDDSAAPIRLADENVIGSVLVFRDISERKRSEAELRKQQEWLRVTLASIGDAVIATDTQSRVSFLNPVAEELTGWIQAEAEGQALETVFSIVNEHTIETVENPVAKVLRDGKVVGLGNHTVLIAKDGTRRPIDDSAAPIRDLSGQMIGVVLIFRDVTEQRRADQEVRSSEGRKSAILGTSLDPIIAMDHEGKVIEFNPAAERTFGFTRDELIGKELVEFIIPPRLRDDHRWGLAHYLATGEGPVLGKRLELPALRSDGTEFPVEVAITRISTDDPPFFTAYLRDISEEKRAEQYRNARLAVTKGLTEAVELQDGAKAVLQAVCDNLGWHLGFFWTVTEKGDELVCRQSWHTIDASATALEAASCSRTFTKGEGLPGRVWQTGEPVWILDVLTDTNFPRLSSAAKDGLHSAFAVPVIVGDEVLGVVEFFSHRILDPNANLLETMGTVAGQVGQFIERSRAESNLRKSEQAARFLADASAALSVLVDSDSTLQKVATMAVPHFADWVAVDVLESDASLRRVAVAHVDPSKVALAHEVHRRFPSDPSALHGTWNIIRSSKAELVPEISDDLLKQSIKEPELLAIMRELGLKSYIGVPLNVRGKTEGVITFITAESGHRYDENDLAVAHDLAHRSAIAMENARFYRELRDADRRKDEFLATLAHELRNPLAPIRNSLQILKMSRVDEDTAKEIRDVMDRQVEHLVRLVDDLLDVSRVMRGKIELRKEPVELATIMARAVETAMPLIEVQRHQLDVSAPSQSFLLDADPVRLTQVVGNLLTNSAKYTEANGRIWLSARQENDHAVLSIRDSGIGIASDMLPHVFELFVQADYASTKAQGGLGIGLTLVKSLVEMHGGTVEAKSAGLGKGSEFLVRIPLMQRPQTVPTKKDSVPLNQAQPRSGHRLLVVDDNHDAAMTLSALLRLQGHDVRVAHDGNAALEHAAEFRPDLIFLDIGMPGMDGYEVARRIRQIQGLEKVILAALTGWGQQEDRRRTAAAGFNHHLVKPPESKVIDAIVADLKKPHEYP